MAAIAALGGERRFAEESGVPRRIAACGLPGSRLGGITIAEFDILHAAHDNPEVMHRLR